MQLQTCQLSQLFLSQILFGLRRFPLKSSMLQIYEGCHSLFSVLIYHDLLLKKKGMRLICQITVLNSFPPLQLAQTQSPTTIGGTCSTHQSNGIFQSVPGCSYSGLMHIGCMLQPQLNRKFRTASTPSCVISLTDVMK